MPPATPPLDFTHFLGEEILTKHKEAIRQLYSFAKIPVKVLATRYKFSRTIIERVLDYDIPERTRITWTRKPFLLTDKQVDEIIKYALESWEYYILDFSLFHDEFRLEYLVKTLERRVKQQGYFRYITCQKPYLTTAQVIRRFLWAIAYIFWIKE
jgi:hypothetical protein